jgi:hypothetical protein
VGRVPTRHMEVNALDELGQRRRYGVPNWAHVALSFGLPAASPPAFGQPSGDEAAADRQESERVRVSSRAPDPQEKRARAAPDPFHPSLTAALRALWHARSSRARARDKVAIAEKPFLLSSRELAPLGPTAEEKP